MLSVITSHDLELQNNDANLKDLKHATSTSYHAALRVMSDYDHSMDAIDRSLDEVAKAMQQAQHCRLAIELLSADQLADLYKQLEDMAKRTGTEFLTTSRLTSSNSKPHSYSMDTMPPSFSMCP